MATTWLPISECECCGAPIAQDETFCAAHQQAAQAASAQVDLTDLYGYLPPETDEGWEEHFRDANGVIRMDWIADAMA